MSCSPQSALVGVQVSVVPAVVPNGVGTGDESEAPTGMSAWEMRTVVVVSGVLARMSAEYCTLVGMHRCACMPGVGGETNTGSRLTITVTVVLVVVKF